MRWPRVVGWVYGAVLVCAVSFVLLDSFVIPYRSQAVQARSSLMPSATASRPATSATTPSTSAVGGSGGPGDASSSSGAQSTSSAQITDSSYADGRITVTVTTERIDGTDVHVADIQLSDAGALQTALAQDTYGRNVTATTSTIAADHGAVLAINGDFYGAQRSGYVIRDGVLYRSQASSSSQEDLVIMNDGSFRVITEGEVPAEDLLAQGAWQVLSFGPALVEDGAVAVSAADEVDKAMESNPRTAIAQVGQFHYLMVVADGRTDDDAGLSLEQLAQFLVDHGAETAYNLDGGGSSTMWFNGQVVNTPTSGHGSGERAVSDIVYIS
ncbi:MAG: phosphodiester glycosidase family protein [Propionibacteriaceae bacterium]|jgi:exopolysaccharide biosynthesis protein|nr:phosphodiester glycosidase family protein [Propionibacteriaceae bacterium]